jgi:hypothetical protein
MTDVTVSQLAIAIIGGGFSGSLVLTCSLG